MIQKWKINNSDSKKRLVLIQSTAYEILGTWLTCFTNYQIGLGDTRTPKPSQMQQVGLELYQVSSGSQIKHANPFTKSFIDSSSHIIEIYI